MNVPTLIFLISIATWNIGLKYYYVYYSSYFFMNKEIFESWKEECQDNPKVFYEIYHSHRSRIERFSSEYFWCPLFLALIIGFIYYFFG